MLKQMMYPDLYHKKVPWNLFEGWYFKITDPRNALVFIPGIFHGDKKGMEAHGFIQVLDGRSVLYDYVFFPLDAFSSKNSRNGFEVTIAENRFSPSGFHLDLDTALGRIVADIEFSHTLKWNNNSRSNRSMGFYNFIPFMECYSQVCLMDAEVCGSIHIDGQPISLSSAKGYVEKNWGRQFPYSWVWVQSNSFSTPGVSLSASIGHIPFPLGSFRGFLMGLQLGSDFHEFTSMNHSKLSIEQHQKDVVITASNPTHTLEIRTESQPDRFILCRGPKEGRMQPLVEETLTARVHIKLTDIRDRKVAYEGIGENAGIEYGGDRMHLLGNSDSFKN